VTGGEDDLISVYDYNSRSILARGIGHLSYVSAVVFDAVQCDNDRYRIVSVGQDTRLILWDLDKVNSEAEKGIYFSN
jgi:WD40 repeat protein